MDQFWLFEDEDLDEEEPEPSKEEEEKAELEERLYSIVHHNDLSQPLPPDLAKHYDIQTTVNGEVDVILKHSLEEVQSEECKTVDTTLELQNTNNIDTFNGSVVDIFSPEVCNRTRSYAKKFRYSDVNLDEISPIQDDEVVESTAHDINYFNHGPSVFKKKNKRFLNLKIPSSFKPSDWKSDSNESFISINLDNLGIVLQKKEYEILKQMTSALTKLNPNQNIKKLADFAFILYKRNTKLYRRRKMKKRKQNNKSQFSNCDTTFDSSFEKSYEIKKAREQIQQTFDVLDSYDSLPNHTVPKQKNSKHKSREMGSISLNISPFRPTESVEVVDLLTDTEEEFNNSRDTGESSMLDSSGKTPKKLKRNPHLPEKWTKEMVKFYSTPTKSKLVGNLDKVINNLRKSTSPKDWPLDPRDASGTYQQKKNKHPNHKCMNCFQRGHYTHSCPQPVKDPTCTLCGELYHSSYSCPNKICWKCGVSIRNQGLDGECKTCYLTQFDMGIPCQICGEVTHRSENCTDLWRSYHATTYGEKVVPREVNVNKRKYCCNCAEKGHFSHECPFVLYYGQQVSPFVRNYSAEPLQKGVVDIAVPKSAFDFNSYEGDQFLQKLADSTLAVITSNEDTYQFLFQIQGTFEQCSKVKGQIEEYVNKRKRKRFEPPFNRKRQKVRY